MLLAVNIGNTNVSYGLFDGLQIMKHDRLALADLPLMPERIGPARLSRIAVASVAPSRTEQAAALLATNYGLPVLLAGEDLPYGIEIECDEPRKVGADRVVNAVAAFARVKRACVVVDVGTAITVDAVSARGDFVGGAIAPGPGTMLRALHEHTELLPDVVLARPTSPVGRNTVDAMRSGVYWGTVGMVNALVAQMSAAISGRPPVLLTGGGAEAIAPELAFACERVHALTLEGLAILAARA